MQGVFGSGVCFYLQSWCISVRGPLYSAMFTPVCTVVTTVVAAAVLQEELHIGRHASSLLSTTDTRKKKKKNLTRPNNKNTLYMFFISHLIYSLHIRSFGWM